MKKKLLLLVLGGAIGVGMTSTACHFQSPPPPIVKFEGGGPPCIPKPGQLCPLQ